MRFLVLALGSLLVAFNSQAQDGMHTAPNGCKFTFVPVARSVQVHGFHGCRNGLAAEYWRLRTDHGNGDIRNYMSFYIEGKQNGYTLGVTRNSFVVSLFKAGKTVWTSSTPAAINEQALKRLELLLDKASFEVKVHEIYPPIDTGNARDYLVSLFEERGNPVVIDASKDRSERVRAPAIVADDPKARGRSARGG